MDQTLWVVWVVLVGVAAVLGLFGSCFSVRSLRWFTCVTALCLAIAVVRFGLAHPEYKSANLVDSFLSGVDQVTIALLHPLWPGRVPAPGVAGRWIIAVALLLGYRQLECRALRRQAPELDLSKIGRGRPADQGPSGHDRQPGHRCDDYPTAGQRHAQLAAELRFRLPTMEIRAPAILPGGARTNALAKIAETSGVSGAGMVGAVFRFSGMFWPGPRLVRIRSWVETAAGTRITILLEDAKTGLPIAAKTVAGDNFNEAASMVAGYIAQHIFAMDPTVPEWCYGVPDGRDLGAMQLVRMKRVYAACPTDVSDSREEQICILSKETGGLRTAGIVRYELAQLLALQGQHLESLRLHALNRELHPRFYRSRYRLAMSLEMIANPEHYLPDTKPTWHNLGETLQILARCGLTDGRLTVSAEYPTGDGKHVVATPPSGKQEACMRVSQELAIQLLRIAAKDLRKVRTQLKWRNVMWAALVHRDERAMWRPHRRHRYRQTFQDGVCTAELLLAVRCRLREPVGKKPDRQLGRVRDFAERAYCSWHLWRACTITSFIAGKPTLIKAVLANPHRQWWDADAAQAGLDSQPRVWPRVRWRVRQRSTASWQAAYNTACLYAALADAARTGGAPEGILQGLEHRVNVSLRRVVENPDSELERAWDWISSDPDFHAMRHNSKTFQDFLHEQKKQEYPVFFMNNEECPNPHTDTSESLAAPRTLPASARFRILSPVLIVVPPGQ